MTRTCVHHYLCMQCNVNVNINLNVNVNVMYVCMFLHIYIKLHMHLLVYLVMIQMFRYVCVCRYIDIYIYICVCLCIYICIDCVCVSTYVWWYFHTVTIKCTDDQLCIPWSPEDFGLPSPLGSAEGVDLPKDQDDVGRAAHPRQQWKERLHHQSLVPQACRQRGRESLLHVQPIHGLIYLFFLHRCADTVTYKCWTLVSMGPSLTSSAYLDATFLKVIFYFRNEKYTMSGILQGP